MHGHMARKSISLKQEYVFIDVYKTFNNKTNGCTKCFHSVSSTVVKLSWDYVLSNVSAFHAFIAFKSYLDLRS